MNLKKGENKYIQISLYSYKLFLKRKITYLFVVGSRKKNLELKISLIFSLIYISLKTNQKFWRLDKSIIDEAYNIFFQSKREDTQKYLTHILEEETKKMIFGSRLDELNVVHLYENIESFYSNCEILDYLRKKEKLRRIIITEEGVSKFVTINKNLKFILNFIKTSSPTQFNTIYRKLMNLV